MYKKVFTTPTLVPLRSTNELKPQYHNNKTGTFLVEFSLEFLPRIPITLINTASNQAFQSLSLYLLNQASSLPSSLAFTWASSPSHLPPHPGFRLPVFIPLWPSPRLPVSPPLWLSPRLLVSPPLWS